MPVVLDSDSMAKLMNQAQKLRKDGYIEWHKGASHSFAGLTERSGIVVLQVPSRRLSVAGAKQKLTCTANDCRRVTQDAGQIVTLTWCPS